MNEKLCLIKYDEGCKIKLLEENSDESAMSSVEAWEETPVSALLNDRLQIFNNVRMHAKQERIHPPNSSCPWRAADEPTGLR